MREIKFRLWVPADDEEPGYMISGDELAFEDYQPLRDLLTRDGIMQYAGLKDKNGVDVYDGDIYRNLDSGLIGKLRILDGVGGLYVLCTEYKDGRVYNNHPFSKHDTTNFEVIGNIYENAELIGGDT